MVEAYLTLGLVDEAKRNAAVLGYNYPGDPWYSDAYDLMSGKGLRPAVTPTVRKHGITVPAIHFPAVPNLIKVPKFF
jgi:outer membrane protein assembly factor BamD